MECQHRPQSPEPGSGKVRVLEEEHDPGRVGGHQGRGQGLWFRAGGAHLLRFLGRGVGKVTHSGQWGPLWAQDSLHR